MGFIKSILLIAAIIGLQWGCSQTPRPDAESMQRKALADKQAAEKEESAQLEADATAVTSKNGKKKLRGSTDSNEDSNAEDTAPQDESEAAEDDSGAVEESAEPEISEEEQAALDQAEEERIAEEKKAAEEAQQKEEDDCKAANKYYDLTVNQCTERALADVDCTHEGVLGDSSEFLVANQKEQIKGLLEASLQGYSFHACVDDDDKGIYSLILVKEVEKEGATSKVLNVLEVPK